MPDTIKKLGIAAAGVVLVVFAGAFFLDKQYWFSFLTLCLLLLLLRVEDIKRLVFNQKDGIKADLKTSKKD